MFKNSIKLYIIFCITIFNFTTIYANSDDDITKYDILLDEGKVINNTGMLTSTYILNKENGDSVNFYVENNGSSPVIISINDKTNKILKVGEKGHISSKITSKNEQFEFKVQSYKNNNINITHRIKQTN